MSPETPDMSGPEAGLHEKGRAAWDGAGKGQNPQNGQRSWEGALWASPLEIQEQVASSGSEGGPASPQQGPQSLPEVAGAQADHKATDIDIPLPGVGRRTGVTEVDLILPPLLDAVLVMQLCNDLEQFACAKIVSSSGSWREGAIMKVATSKKVSLLEVLHLMPEVAHVWEDSPLGPEIHGRSISGVKGQPSTESGKRICVMLKHASKPKQLALNL